MTISYWKGMGWFSHGRQTGVMRPKADVSLEHRAPLRPTDHSGSQARPHDLVERSPGIAVCHRRASSPCNGKSPQEETEPGHPGGSRRGQCPRA